MNITKRLLKPAKDFSWDGNTGESLVFHTTLGNTYKGAEDTLKVRHLSYHFIVDKDGKIYQLVDLGRSAWHAGIKHKPNLRVREFFGDDNPNRRSVGVALVSSFFTDITDAQRDSAVWLIKEIGKQTGVRYNARNIFTHQEITSYKPEFVKYIRRDVLEQLKGFKDDKDNVAELSKMVLLIKLLGKLVKKLMQLRNG